MKIPLIVITATVAGCSAPGVEVWGGTTSKQSVGGHSFTVNHTRSRAEAYRTNMAFKPSRAAVFESAARAMEQASGCRAPRSTLVGDVALVKGDLIC